MNHIAILMTVHNRKNTSLKCLKLLYKSIEYTSQYVFDIYLTDDKSNDGTSEAIIANFPDVNIISGNGDLFWGRGMIKAWEEALKVKDYDFYIWLNDDAHIFKRSLSTLIHSLLMNDNRSIVSGAFRSEMGDKTTYGGKINLNGNFLDPNGKLQEINFLNGNFVIIPKVIFKKIGMLDYHYKHGMGDYDYGLRAKKAGFSLFLTQEYVGFCERHDTKKLKCYDNNFNIYTRFKFLYSNFGPNPLKNFKFYFIHFSFFTSIKYFLYTNIITLFPYLTYRIIRK